MIQYFEDGNLAVFDGLAFRRDQRTGYYLNAKTHKRLHVYVWEYYNGKVPKGYHVHHKDFDKTNNDISNLTLLSAHDHITLHGRSWDEERLKKQIENLDKNARPKASEWHRSHDGREWHKKHYEKMKVRLHQEKTFVCEECGKEFTAIDNGSNRFCSGKCKSKNRRKSGIDNEKRVCVCCGEEFEVNKYAKTRVCSRLCSRKLRQDQKHKEGSSRTCV